MYVPPPDSSDSDDYEGFSFGDEQTKPKRVSLWQENNNFEYEMLRAINAGDVDYLKELMTTKNININSILNSGYTLLHQACNQGNPKSVQYLIEMGADVNKRVESKTPLMEACYNKNLYYAKDIIAILLENGALVNICDKQGTTPLMYSCINNNIEAVKLILNASPSLDVINNKGCSAIFHAIESKNIEIVKLLIDAGCDIEKENYEGFTPRQVARFNDYNDMLKVFPSEIAEFDIPFNYTYYCCLEDYLPGVLPNSTVPQYFPTIYAILKNIKMAKFAPVFVKNHISLGEFLAMTDKKLEDIEIKLPFERQKIMLGIVGFFYLHWTPSSIVRVKRGESDSFYDFLLLIGNQMHNIVILKFLIQYVHNNLKEKQFGNVDIKSIKKFQSNLKEYQSTLDELITTIKYLESFSPRKPPLYIDYDDYIAQKNKKSKFFLFKWISFTAIACCLAFKLKKYLM